MASTTVAAKLVRSVLLGSPHGLPTRDIYRRALKAPDIPKVSTYVPPPVVLYDRRANGTLDSTSRSVNEKKPVPIVPNPTHPIRSMKYLKKSVLPSMLEHGELRHVRIPLSTLITPPAQQGRKAKAATAVKSNKMAWVWQVVPEGTETTIPAAKKTKTPTIPVSLQNNALAGAAPNLDHLSKRRRRARLAKHPQVLATMKQWKFARKAYKGLQVEQHKNKVEKAAARKELAQPTGGESTQPSA